nr:odorant receptor 73 [Graphosoma rubrolineatum]
MSTIWPQLSKLNWFGHWPTDKGIKVWLQRTASYTILLWTICLFGAELFSSQRTFYSGDLIGMFINLNEFFSGLQCYLATLVFVVYRRPLEEAMRLLEGLTQEVTNELEALAKEEFNRRRYKGKLAYYMFFGTFVMICHWAVRPLLNMAIYGESSLIVHSWVPFSMSSLAGFIGNYLFQIVPCLSFCLGFCLFASIFVCFSEMLLGHFAILGKKLSSMDYGKGPLDSRLANCIDHHTRLLKICSMFQDITSIPLLTQCIFTVLALCMAMFELTNVQGASSGRIISVFAEAQQELLFLATYCWYGNEITMQCLELLRPGYMSNWYQGTRSEKKMLLNLMTRTRKPIYLGGFIKMDMLTFINVSFFYSIVKQISF